MKRLKELSESIQLDIVNETSYGNDWEDPEWSEWIVEQIIEELEGMGFVGVEVNFSGFWSQGDGASFTCKSIYWPLFRKHFRGEMDFQSNQLTEWEEELKKFEWLLGAGGDPEELIDLPQPIIKWVIENSDGRNGIFGRVVRVNHRYYHEKSVEFNLELEMPYDVVENEDRDLDEYQITSQDERELIYFVDYVEKWVDNWVEEKNREIYQRIQKEYEDHVKCTHDQLMEEDEVWNE